MQNAHHRIWRTEHGWQIECFEDHLTLANSLVDIPFGLEQLVILRENIGEYMRRFPPRDTMVTTTYCERIAATLHMVVHGMRLILEQVGIFPPRVWKGRINGQI